MASKLCCTVPERTESPELPNARILAPKESSTAVAALCPEYHDEVRAIFDSASDPPEYGRISGVGGHAAFALSPSTPTRDSPSQLSLVKKLKKRLSKGSTKSATSNAERRDAEGKTSQLHGIEEAKQDVEASLLNSGSRGGYDSDATSLQIRECPSTPQEDIRMSPIRNRKTRLRPALKDTPWGSRKPSISSTPGTKSIHFHTPDKSDQARKASHTTMSPTPRSRSVSGRRKLDFQRQIRHSRSESLLVHSLSRDRDSSEVFPTATEYIAILQALAADMSSQEVSVQERDQVVPLRIDLQASDPSSTSYKSAVSGIESDSAQSDALRQEPARNHQSDTKGTSDESTELATSDNTMGPVEQMNELAGVDSGSHGEAGLGSSRDSIHLWSMRISQHLRTISVATNQTAATVSPAKPQSRTYLSNNNSPDGNNARTEHRRQQSNSAFTSGQVPSEWGKVITDTASSVYSSRVQTQAETPTLLSHSPGNLSAYEIPGSNSPHAGFPKIRLENSEGAQTITSRNFHPFDMVQSHHVRELAATTPTEAVGSEEKLLSPKVGGTTTPDRRQSARSSLLRSISSTSNANAPASSRSSRFKEDEDEIEADKSPPTKTKFTRPPSLFNLFRPAKARPIVTSDNTTVPARYDGPSDSKGKGKAKQHTPQKQQARAEGFGMKQSNDAASNLFANALIANQAEKTALILPENREMLCIPLHAPRERSASVSSRSISSLGAPTSHEGKPSPSRAASHTKPPTFSTPQFLTPDFSGESPTSPKLATSATFLDPTDTISIGSSPRSRRDSSAIAPSDTAITALKIDTTATPQSSEESTVPDLGAWAHYPSHTRAHRTGSANQTDLVFTRDFELELLQRRACAADAAEDGTDGIVVVLPRSRKGGRRGRSGMSKSKSLTLGAKRVIKGYSQMFKSQSLEFMAHGHGHRTSISGGGMLEHPELEVLPPVWAGMDGGVGYEMRDLSKNGDGSADEKEGDRGDLFDARLLYDGAHDSRQIANSSRNSHDPFNPVCRSAGSSKPDAARLWSQLYAACVELPSSRSTTPVGSICSTSSQMSSERQARAALRRSASSPMSRRSESPCLRLSPPVERQNPSIANVGMTKSPSLPYLRRLSMTKTNKKSETNENNKMHTKNDSFVSDRSLRRSTNDLCLLLVEAERKERDRLLEAAAALVSNSSVLSP